MESKETFALIISIAGGTFSILASIFNWDFFFNNRKAIIFMKMFGRTGSRIFYGILGGFLYFLAYRIYFG